MSKCFGLLCSLTGSGEPLLLSSGMGVEAGVERGGARVARGGARAESLLLLTRRGVSVRRWGDHRKLRVNGDTMNSFQSSSSAWSIEANLFSKVHIHFSAFFSVSKVTTQREPIDLTPELSIERILSRSVTSQHTGLANYSTNGS